MVRVVEEAGIPTVEIGSGRDIMEAVKPPRAVFMNFPLGHQTGKPFDKELQRAIVVAALEMLKSATEPGTIVDLPYVWKEGDDSWQEEAVKRGVLI